MRATLFVLLCLFAASCDRRSTAGGVISRPGTYVSSDGRHTLLVTETGSGIVNYSILDAAGGKPAASGGGFSTYHRWFFYWDPQNRLWAHNSDKGPFAVHEETAPGQWRVTQIDASSPLLASIPIPVRDHLPDSAKRMLNLNAGGPGR